MFQTAAAADDRAAIFKILGAMLSLQEFTIADLVRVSGQTEGNVREILGDLANDVESTEGEPFDQQNATDRMMRLRQDGVAPLRAKLKRVFDALPPEAR
jgi:hypothetical protein